MLIESMTAKQYREKMYLYGSALKIINTKFEIINEDFNIMRKANPIESMKSRLKSAESAAAKLIRKGYEPTIENAVQYLDDLAGMRIICGFTEDIFSLVDVVHKQSDLKVLKVKDYITHPKKNGYRSYHMLVKVPVRTSDGISETKAEIQIRTIAMDFWASLEHKIRYKFEGRIPEELNFELVECADIVAYLDHKMLSLNNEMKKYK
ncbi:MAG: GTP pyrophosphokinase family protein [Oscillospiraceae bacterium]|nr:GTP pyrophosphokinase family protein [Oscillospiraceae bacterium]